MIGRASNLESLTTNTVMKQVVKVDNEDIEADLVVGCIGLPPNRDSINKLVDPAHVDEHGRIKVNEYLQVEGFENIYAIGDCCNTSEDKMAAFAGKHGELVSANLLKELTGAPLVKYQQVG